ncbi:GNAT family N-acetyltransferase [Azospirillum picis]|uniref:GNAT superfamily N-acetyltransferase n=1 Tax=Azospirillum picis TaxID=488438 RepID=A0ABU0MFS5_9PROT|nr:GNAT family N-acetyltransferase [Azospirillum picis]MBP2298272.1 GNAT superfamily N-acetyltransferase [Azospirillum picis]MDQ0532109.1 GNAT superfamily N-acetyltransferase [Azospirillum picis]
MKPTSSQPEVIRPASTGDAASLAPLTWASYRSLLSLADPEERRLCRPCAVAAWDGDRPVGLALSAVTPGRPLEEGEQTLLSLVVARPWRRRGLALRLLAALEDALPALGVARLGASYSSRLPAAAAFAATLRAAGWPEPEATRLRICGAVRDTVAVFRNRDSLLARLQADGFRLWSWRQRGVEAEALARTLIDRGEAPAWAQPQHWSGTLDPDLSLVIGGADGMVAGWALCVHQPALARWFFPVGWVRPPYDRRGWLMGTYAAGAERVAERHGGDAVAVIETASEQAGMWRLFERRFQPHAHWTDRMMASARRLNL